MFKKIICLVLFACTLLTLFNFKVYNSKPYLKSVGENYKAYISKSSSKIIPLPDQRIWLRSASAESCEFNLEQFDITSFLAIFNAELVLTEEIEQGVSYYAYSKEIRYLEYINGKKVNLHLFVSKNRVKVGAPIIYESF